MALYTKRVVNPQKNRRGGSIVIKTEIALDPGLRFETRKAQNPTLGENISFPSLKMSIPVAAARSTAPIRTEKAVGPPRWVNNAIIQATTGGLLKYYVILREWLY